MNLCSLQVSSSRTSGCPIECPFTGDENITGGINLFSKCPTQAMCIAKKARAESVAKAKSEVQALANCSRNLHKNVEALPSKGIIHALKDSCRESKVRYYVGPIWTTDAPYRETRSKINYFQRKGILAVDQESSAIFSVGIYRKVRVGCILVASTNLTQPKATIGFYKEMLRDEMFRVAETSTKTIVKLQYVPDKNTHPSPSIKTTTKK